MISNTKHNCGSRSHTDSSSTRRVFYIQHETKSREGRWPPVLKFGQNEPNCKLSRVRKKEGSQFSGNKTSWTCKVKIQLWATALICDHKMPHFTLGLQFMIIPATATLVLCSPAESLCVSSRHNVAPETLPYPALRTLPGACILINNRSRCNHGVSFRCVVEIKMEAGFDDGWAGPLGGIGGRGPAHFTRRH